MNANSPQLQMARLALASLSPQEKQALLRDIGEPDAVLKREQVAARFGVTDRAVDKWAADGLLRRVQLPGRKRGCGFLRSDVERLMAGGSV